MRKVSFIVGLMVLILACVAQPVSASMQFSLGIGNTALVGSGYPAPFGDVYVDLVDSTHATILLTNVNVDPQFMYGDGKTLALNTNGDVTVVGGEAAIVQTQRSGFSNTHGSGLEDFSLEGAKNESGFGDFNFTLDTFDGYTHSSNTISFTLQKTTGSWANVNDVLTPNDNGY